MAKVKLHITDARMLELIELLKENGTIRFRQEFCDALEIHKQLIRQIQLGLQHFTAAQVAKACEVYNVNANWIADLELNTFRNTPLTKSSTRRHKVKQSIKI